MPNPLHIGFVVYPGITQLDMTGPFEVFARIPGAEVHLAWKTLDPIRSDTGLILTPTVTFEECPDLDVVCVPGGPGVNALLDDGAVLSFVRGKAATARYVTSVCTGALLLGAAGLLAGRKAATHWASREFLPAFGATPVADRVCIDGHLITGGGVTAGIDFGLLLAAELAGEPTAERIQLFMEYDPSPPFSAGSAQTAPPAVVADCLEAMQGSLAERRAAVERATAPAPPTAR
jgi:cyclohexyl-isocyanide hydratase